MDKAFEIQKQVRDNVNTFHTYITDLQNWESEMKRKEAALHGEFEQDLPPVRSKIKKEKPVLVKPKTESRIKSYDYKSWDQYDVDKACEDVDMADVGPTSLDGKKSTSAKLEKLREEAQYEKERGNTFVKQEKWDEAIACYNRAIELVKDDAIYFANRGLCYLKKDSLHQAESDCTEALRLDPTYVKAYQRRATARERLGSLRSASHDLAEVLKLEPRNNAARKQLEAIKARMGTKGSKSKSSPSTTPTVESKPITKLKPHPKIVELPAETKPVLTVNQWRHGVGENITVIKPVKKPPHLRSKRPLKAIPIQEIQLGKTLPEPTKPPTRLKIIEIEDDLSHGDTNNNDSNKKEQTPPEMNSKGDCLSEKTSEVITGGLDSKDNNGSLNSKDNNGSPNSKDNGSLNSEKDKVVASPESDKLISESILNEKCVINLVPPVNSVQFMSEWKYLKGNDEMQCHYLSLIEPSRIPSIFANALESDILSSILRILHDNTDTFANKITEYLTALSSVKRFSALAMFLSDNDKQVLTKLLEHCRTNENCADCVIADLKNKYEL